MHTLIKNSSQFKTQLEKSPIFLFARMNGCHFCEAVKPVWDEFVTEESSIPLAEIEAEHLGELKDVLDYQFQGFPTFLLCENNNCIEYSGNRSKESFKNFIKEHSPRKSRGGTYRRHNKHRSHTRRSHKHSRSHKRSSSHKRSRSHKRSIPRDKHSSPKKNNFELCVGKNCLIF